MKRIWICLLALLVLAGCGDPGDVAVTTVYETDDPPRATLTAERDAYDPSVETVWCVLSYEGEGEPLEYGASYWLDVREEDGTWTQVPLAENTGWDAVLYTLPSGEKQAFPCSLSMFDYDFSGGGTFRVVKEIGDQTLTAEAAASGAVVFTEAGMENADAAETFLQKVSLGIPSQLRTLQNYYESWPMLIDVIYENDSFRWRMRTGGEITEKRFSYVVTDGTDVYLSNGADWDSTERYDSDKAFLLPSGSGGDLVPRAQELMADQTAGSTVRYRIWSADGVWDASLTETPTEFGVGWQRPGEGSSGSLYDLGDWYDEAPAITDIAWQADGTLRLTCRLEAGGVQTFDFDPETGYLTEALCGSPAAE